MCIGGCLKGLRKIDNPYQDDQKMAVAAKQYYCSILLTIISGLTEGRDFLGPGSSVYTTNTSLFIERFSSRDFIKFCNPKLKSRKSFHSRHKGCEMYLY